MQRLKLYRQIMSFVTPYWKMALLMLLSTAAYASTNALVVKAMEPIIDEGFVKNSIASIYHSVMILFIIVMGRGFCFFASSYCSRWLSSQVVLDIRKQMFEHLQQLPSRYFDHANGGEILSKFNYDVQQITSAATNAIIVALREGITVLSLLAFLFYSNWKLTLSILVIAPIVGIIIRIVSKRLRKLAQKIQDDMGEMNHILNENISGQKIVKIYQGKTYENNKFNRAITRIKYASIKTEVASAITTPVIELLIISVLSFVIVSLSVSASNGNVTPGSFVAYIGMMAMLFSPIKKLTRINEYIQKGLAASESIFNFLSAKREINIDSKNISQIKGHITFKNLNFRYQDDTDLILDQFSLDITAGTTVAIVGASGSGKSSIASLIPKLYTAPNNTIFIDGIDINQINTDFLRQNISFVNQETILFNDTVKRNIAYGERNEDIDESKVIDAAKKAFAYDFISQLSNGFETYLGDSGQRLSGGQKQRLAIARAIYKSAPIFIFDEATSALDSESEEHVQQALNELIQDKTAIIIAHRLSTVKNADYIVVLEHGKIIETGTHKELLDRKGTYFKLHNLGGSNYED